mmetsp:Transcript_63367/g.185264  ORF Transcript_63367/g.185264 Transcript_63367/m.185264 type:complete len:260 (+) Transcript_63367:829-1608(+)
MKRWLPRVVPLPLQPDGRDGLAAGHHELLATTKHVPPLMFHQATEMLLAGPVLVHLGLGPAARHERAVPEPQAGRPAAPGLAALPQEPGPELLICVRHLKDAVAGPLRDRHFKDKVFFARRPCIARVQHVGLGSSICTSCHESSYGRVVIIHRIDHVIGTMEAPDGIVYQGGHTLLVEDQGTQGHCSCKGCPALSSIHCQLPGCDATHAKARDIYSVRVAPILDGLLDCVQQRGLHRRRNPWPARPGITLRDHHHHLLR